MSVGSQGDARFLFLVAGEREKTKQRGSSAASDVDKGQGDETELHDARRFERAHRP